MAATFDAVTTNSPATGTSFSFSHTIGGAVTNGAVAVLIAFDVAGIAVTFSALTIDGVDARPAITGTDFANGNSRTVIFGRATGSKTGAITIAGTVSASCTMAVVAMSASGVDQATPINNGASHNAPSWSDTLTLTSAASDLSFDVVTDTSGGNNNFSTNQLEKWDFVSQFVTSCEGGVAATPAASVAHTTSNTQANEGTHSGANFKASSAPASDPLQGAMLIG